MLGRELLIPFEDERSPEAAKGSAAVEGGISNTEGAGKRIAPLAPPPPPLPVRDESDRGIDLGRVESAPGLARVGAN